MHHNPVIYNGMDPHNLGGKLINVWVVDFDVLNLKVSNVGRASAKTTVFPVSCAQPVLLQAVVRYRWKEYISKGCLLGPQPSSYY